MIHFGFGGGVLPRTPDDVTKDFVSHLAAQDVTVVALHLGPTPQDVVDGGGASVRKILTDHGISVVQATGYNPNMVTDDEELARQGLRRLKLAFEAARSLGAGSVLTGCGSISEEGFYAPHPANHSPEAESRLIARLGAAADLAAAARIPIELEPHVTTTLDSASSVARVLRAVDSPWIRVNFDPVNLVDSLHTLFNAESICGEWRAELAPWLSNTVHIKDARAVANFVVQIEEAPPGHGTFPIVPIVADAIDATESTNLIIEHLAPDQAFEALDWLKASMSQEGLLGPALQPE
jgi:sugar phosphate isomerase/epimerase